MVRGAMIKILAILFLSVLLTNAQSFSLADRAFLASSQRRTSLLLRTITTDASTTPTTVQTRMTLGQTAVAVFTGDQPTAENFFYLYVVRNGGTPVKLKMFRWSKRIITGSVGDAIALGTSNGRTLQIAQMKAPASLETISGVTGTANCDKAGPPIWSPSGYHILLPSINSAFTLVANGSDRIIFVSEYDGVRWSNARWIRVPAGANTTLRATYEKVALANYTGATISVIAPTNSIVGGTMATMSLTFPAITGTSRNVTNVTTLMSAIASAVSGDEIVFADGTYALTNGVAHGSFVANESAGNRGWEGITFRSLSGTRANVIISRSANTNGGWVMDQAGNTGKTVWWKDLTFDGSCTTNTDATNYGLRWYDGSISMQNVRVTGTNLVDSDGEGVLYVRNLANNSTVNVDYLFCQFDNQNGRQLCNSGFQTNAPTGGGSLNPGKRRIIACDVFTTATGAAASIHNMCTFYRLDLSMYGGSIYDSGQYACAVGYNATNLFLWTSFPQTGTAARSKNEIVGGSLFGCNWTFNASAFTPSGASDPNQQRSSYYFNNFVQSNVSGSTAPFALNTTNTTELVEHNIFTGNSGQAIITSYGGSEFNFNIVTNMSFGIHNYSRLGTYTPTLTAIGNTFRGCTTAIYSTNNAFTAQFTNNITRTSGTSMLTDTNGMAAMTSNYNVFDPTVTGYTAGANDITGADAGLDSNNFPTAAGNCDGNGDTAAIDWVGGSDPFGLVLVYKPTRVSRGAREIQAVYSGAELYPDAW